MKTVFSVWIIFLFSLPCLASRISLFPLSLEYRYLENEDQDLYFQKMETSYSMALTFTNYQFGLDIAQWSLSSNAPLISFKELYSEIGTTHLFLVSSLYENIYFYSGLGIGMYESKLRSQFAGATEETSSGQILFASAIGSMQFIYSYFHAALDFRLLMSKDYRPQPTPTLIGKIGISF